MKIYRLDYAKVFLVMISLLLIACEMDKDTVEFERVRTIVSGNVSDVQRNKNIPNFEVRLIRSSIFVTLGGSGIQSEEVATVLTDALGNYEIEFDYIKDGKDYGFEKVYYGFPYHTNFIHDYGPIVPG